MTDYDRVELVWPGKTREIERPPALPFQVIERINDVTRSRGSAAPLERLSVSRGGGGQSLPDWWPEGWRNKLIWGDNKYVLSSLLEEYAGKVDLIYIDPPFATGSDFSTRIPIGDSHVEKEPTILEETAFRDFWQNGPATYLSFLYERLALLRNILHPTHGSLFLRLDWRQAYHARSLLDDLFSAAAFRNEIAVSRTKTIKAEKGRFHHAYDTLLFYSNGPARFNSYRKELPKKEWKWVPMHMVGTRKNKSLLTITVGGHRFTAPRGRRWMLSQAAFDDAYRRGLVRIDDKRNEPLFHRRQTTIGSDWTDVPGYSKKHRYPTENSEDVLERVIESSSNPGDLVLDCFVGSGTTAAVAERLGRRWIAADIGRFAIQTTRKRLLDTSEPKPFEVMNIGRYDRSQWQGTTVGEAIGEYYDFIAQLYCAQRLQGFHHLHAQKDGRMVHFGATDSPVTADELEQAVAECADCSTRGLDVLGWEWEMGLNPAGKDALAREYGVDIHLLNIPREVMDQKAVDAGDIHFFELSVAEVAHEVGGDEVTLELQNFCPALDEYMAQKTEGKIGQWSDWIDYWSVDFDYDGETFINQWQAYRTKAEPKLNLRSDPHRYDAPGAKRIVVKVIDIFGNDTTVPLDVDIAAE